MDKKIIGLFIVAVFAVAIVFGGVHSVLSVIDASADAGEGEYVARLATDNDQDPALAALRYVCPFH